MVDWINIKEENKRATGVYTSSWIAPQAAGVHSNQYFHYMASKGEVRVNQGKRGYDVTGDEGSISWINPYVSR
jgi:D-galacturonate reductase